MKSTLLLTVLLLVGADLQAQNTAPVHGTPTESVPISATSTTPGEGVTGVPSAGTVTRSSTKMTIVQLQNSCFATNLRSVSNPISPNSIVTAKMHLNIGGKDTPISVSYPADVTTAKGLTGANPQPMQPSTYDLPSGSTAAIYGNTIRLEIPTTVTTSVSASGAVTTTGASDKPLGVTAASFNQQITSCSGGPVYGTYGYSTTHPAYPCGSYMGKTGTLSAQIGTAVAANDNSSITIPVSFPGQTGFCGGFYSPLMVFFDDHRPDFSAVTDFPINAIGKTAWPEKGAPGAFLVIDRKGKGRINQKNQVFGDDDDHKNGFEALRDLDKNRDGWISSADPEFKHLYLWFDKNGDGVTQKGELVPLGKRVRKISLDYSKGHVEPLGKNAEEREVGYVILKNKKKATIADIWLSPMLQPSGTLTEQRVPSSDK